VGVDAVEAHSQNCGIALGVLGLVDLKIVRLACAAGGLILGIEIEDYPFAAVVLQAHGGSFLGGQGEIGGQAPFRGRC